MKQYEYRSCEVSTLTTGQTTVFFAEEGGYRVRSINELGKEGWELVTITTGTGSYSRTKLAIFKKKKEK